MSGANNGNNQSTATNDQNTIRESGNGQQQNTANVKDNEPMSAVSTGPPPAEQHMKAQESLQPGSVQAPVAEQLMPGAPSPGVPGHQMTSASDVAAASKPVTEGELQVQAAAAVPATTAPIVDQQVAPVVDSGLTASTKEEGDEDKDSDDDEAEIVEESPCGRWLKRREEVKYRDVPGIDTAYLGKAFMSLSDYIYMSLSDYIYM